MIVNNLHCCINRTIQLCDNFEFTNLLLSVVNGSMMCRFLF